MTKATCAYCGGPINVICSDGYEPEVEPYEYAGKCLSKKCEARRGKHKSEEAVHKAFSVRQNTDIEECYFRLVKAFEHVHVAGTQDDLDTCRTCGFDIRHPIHMPIHKSDEQLEREGNMVAVEMAQIQVMREIQDKIDAYLKWYDEQKEGQ